MTKDSRVACRKLKKDVDSKTILNQLYKNTLLQTTFNSNMLALNKGKPEQMNLKDILKSFIDFREEVITKRTDADGSVRVLFKPNAMRLKESSK